MRSNYFVFGVAAVLLMVVPGVPTVAADESISPTFTDLFRGPDVSTTILSPSGEFVAYQKRQGVFVGNNDVGFIRAFGFSDDEIIEEIEWISDQSVVLQTRNRVSGKARLHSSKLGLNDAGQYSELKWQRHTVDGYVADELLDSPNEIIFARIRREDDFVATELFRVDVFEDSPRLFKRKQSVDTGSEDFYHYAQNLEGHYVVGIRWFDGVPEVWRRASEGDEWQLAWTGSKDADFTPRRVSADGTRLLALSNAFTDKMAAIELNLIDGTLARVIYEHERFDLRALLIQDDEFEPYGVTYSEQGQLRYHFFDDLAKDEFVALQEQFPDKGIVIAGRSADGLVMLVRTSTSKDRGEIHRCDMSTRNCDEFAELSPWLEGKTLGETHVLAIESESGPVIDAFLTLPSSSGDSIPLIAMPHGGPIGVSDSRYFSPGVQWLATQGYAVLQVNYRGSSGYGKEFQSAGLREWGRGIEDDIETAVLSALDRYPQLDRDRIGIFGSSYGGYSALMSVIRNPELFKCAASFAGVTDLTLIFLQSRVDKNPELREAFIRIIGDPNLDFDEQRSFSPTYRYKEIERPVFLAHGTADRVVDIEHSWRLRRLLQLIKRDPTFVVLDEVAHGFEYVEEAAQLYGPLVKFLDSHLKAKTVTDGTRRTPGIPDNETQASMQ